MSKDKLNIVSANGLWLTTSDGVQILDGISGTFNLPLGYNHPGVEVAVHKQAMKFNFLSSDLNYESLDELKTNLKQIGSELGLNSVYLRDLTGSTAIEFAIKLAQSFTKNSGIICFDDSHHGQTITTMGISGAAFRRKNLPCTKLPYSYKVPFGTRKSHLRQLFSKRDIAAVIVEPILGNGGNRPHPPGYFEVLREFCDEHNMLLIVDEVQTGIGRLASISGSHYYGIKPDVLVFGKGLGNGYPIAAVLHKQEQNLLEHYQHSFTCGAHPLSVAAANATLSHVVFQPGFLQRAKKTSIRLRDNLLNLQVTCESMVKEIRGVGFMFGVVVNGPEEARRIIKIALDKYHLRLRPSQDGFGNVVKVRPALIATDWEIDEIVYRLEMAIKDVCKESA